MGVSRFLIKCQWAVEIQELVSDTKGGVSLRLSGVGLTFETFGYLLWSMLTGSVEVIKGVKSFFGNKVQGVYSLIIKWIKPKDWCFSSLNILFESRTTKCSEIIEPSFKSEIWILASCCRMLGWLYFYNPFVFGGYHFRW